jgi:hypothetical protein
VSRIYYGDYEEFSDRTYERFEHYYGDFPDNQQDQWLEAIWEEYNVDGYIDWDDHSYDSAWYMYMSEVLGYEDDDLEKYM